MGTFCKQTDREKSFHAPLPWRLICSLWLVSFIYHIAPFPSKPTFSLTVSAIQAQTQISIEHHSRLWSPVYSFKSRCIQTVVTFSCFRYVSWTSLVLMQDVLIHSLFDDLKPEISPWSSLLLTGNFQAHGSRFKNKAFCVDVFMWAGSFISHLFQMTFESVNTIKSQLFRLIECSYDNLIVQCSKDIFTCMGRNKRFFLCGTVSVLYNGLGC